MTRAKMSDHEEQQFHSNDDEETTGVDTDSDNAEVKSFCKFFFF